MAVGQAECHYIWLTPDMMKVAQMSFDVGLPDGVLVAPQMLLLAGEGGVC